MTDEFKDNPVIEAFELLRKTKRFVRAIKTPTDEADFILKYGIMSYNTKNGLFRYGIKRPIQNIVDLNPYRIMRLLFLAQGDEVLYELLAKELGLPYKTKKEKLMTRAKIRQVCKEMRRTLGINATLNPEANPFVMSGQGIKLALIL